MSIEPLREEIFTRLWEPGVDLTALQRNKLTNNIMTAVTAHYERLQSERDDLRALFDLQQTRMAEATAAWQEEDLEKRAGVLPDLGDLLAWLLERKVSE